MISLSFLLARDDNPTFPFLVNFLRDTDWRGVHIRHDWLKFNDSLSQYAPVEAVNPEKPKRVRRSKDNPIKGADSTSQRNVDNEAVQQLINDGLAKVNPGVVLLTEKGIEILNKEFADKIEIEKELIEERRRWQEREINYLQTQYDELENEIEPEDEWWDLHDSSHDNLSDEIQSDTQIIELEAARQAGATADEIQAMMEAMQQGVDDSTLFLLHPYNLKQGLKGWETSVIYWLNAIV